MCSPSTSCGDRLTCPLRDTFESFIREELRKQSSDAAEGPWGSSRVGRHVGREVKGQSR
jgi:hypothetical protein